MQIILVSASPRRKKILSEAGLVFHTETVEISEIIDENLNWKDAVSQIATDKLDAFLMSDNCLNYMDFLAITADTMVCIDEKILGKPSSVDVAKEYLRLLSGRDHSVLTAVCLYNSKLKTRQSFVEESKVTFKNLSDQEIEDYVASGKCMDKAGAYGLQDEEHDFVVKVDGSLNNVIGFPIERFLKIMNLQSRYLKIKNEIESELQTNSDDKLNTKLIAVSKKFSVDDILKVHEFGQIDFAENYVNEFLTKIEILKNIPIKWHFIGHIQTNKVDKIVGHVDLIHSVDSEKLLNKIITVCEKKQICQKILLQIKFGDEDTKSGFDLNEIEEIIEKIKSNKNIIPSGLMTILPLGINDEQKRIYFRQLRHKLIKIKDQNSLSGFNELSMGMSDDFRLAISEGSTMIRIGSAIFGARS